MLFFIKTRRKALTPKVGSYCLVPKFMPFILYDQSFTYEFCFYEIKCLLGKEKAPTAKVGLYVFQNLLLLFSLLFYDSLI